MTAPDPEVGPADFAPYRTEITDCYCPMCSEVSYALSDVLDFNGQRHLAACRALLTSLQAGKHTRKTLAEHVAEAKAEKAARLAQAQAQADGASPETIAGIERGYDTVRMRDFYATGMGLGIGGRIQ